MPAILEITGNSLHITPSQQNSAMRLHAVGGLLRLGKIKPDEALPSLLEGLKKTDPLHRLDALETLIRLGPPARKARPALAALLEDPNPQVRQSAAGLLKAIEPKGQGPCQP